MEEELANMAEGARPEEFNVDLHQLRRRALNKLPPLDAIELQLSSEEERDISAITHRDVDAEELRQLGDGAREEEFGIDMHNLKRGELLRLPKEGAGVRLQLSEEEVKEIDSVVHPDEWESP